MFKVLSSLSVTVVPEEGGRGVQLPVTSATDTRKEFGEDSKWTRIGGQQQQIINVPAVQLEWIFSVFSMLVAYPIPVIFKKLQTERRFFFSFSHSLEKALSMFFLST